MRRKQDCPTNKQRYSNAEAVQAAARQGHRVYHCQHCQMYHTTKDTRPPNFGKFKKVSPKAVERVWEL